MHHVFQNNQKLKFGYCIQLNSKWDYDIQTNKELLYTAEKDSGVANLNRSSGEQAEEAMVVMFFT